MTGKPACGLDKEVSVALPTLERTLGLQRWLQTIAWATAELATCQLSRFECLEAMERRFPALKRFAIRYRPQGALIQKLPNKFACFLPMRCAPIFVARSLQRIMNRSQ